MSHSVVKLLLTKITKTCWLMKRFDSLCHITGNSQSGKKKKRTNRPYQRPSIAENEAKLILVLTSHIYSNWFKVQVHCYYFFLLK